jgi:hypothetical protein
MHDDCPFELHERQAQPLGCGLAYDERQARSDRQKHPGPEAFRLGHGRGNIGLTAADEPDTIREARCGKNPGPIDRSSGNPVVVGEHEERPPQGRYGMVASGAQ